MVKRTQDKNWAMSVLVAVLAALGVSSSVAYFLREPYNPGFSEFPNVVKSHVVLGAIYLGIAPFQFSPAVRTRWPGYHRIIGRVLTLIGLAIGLSAIFIGLFIPFSGLSEQIVISVFGVFFVVSLVRGFQCIRRKQIVQHREWMIRAFSIGLSIATMRLIFIPALIVLGASDETARSLSIFSFTVSFAIHTLAAEVWIKKTRIGREHVGNGIWLTRSVS